MLINCTIDSVGKVSLSDKDFLASGGEASVYVKGNLACKIYHNHKQMLPLRKIQELQQIKNGNVLIPKHTILDKNGSPIGYAMDFKSDTSPICKLFTKSFKISKNVTTEQINNIVSKMQDTISDIHSAKCLVVDLNELNVIISDLVDNVYFIDCDSYATPKFSATAIMDSIRDRLVKNNQWHTGSDWFSFAVLAFQSYIGIHPFKGKHPSYKPDEWGKRMEDGISVFDKDVSLPRVCEDFSIIPASHLSWFKEIFVKNKRMHPPVLSDAGGVTAIPDQFRFIASSASFESGIEEELPEVIKNVFSFMGVPYYVCTNKIYKNTSELSNNINNCKKVFLCNTGDIYPVICRLKNGHLIGETIGLQVFQDIVVQDAMYRNGCLYVLQDERIVECKYRKFGDNTICSFNVSATINPMSIVMMDGVIFHYLLGKTYMVLPYDTGKCINIAVHELDGYRIIDASSEGNVVVVVVEKNGKYYRFVFGFNNEYNHYDVRRSDDISFVEVNLTVMKNGVAILAGIDNVEVFKGQSVKVIDNPPFNSTTKIFNINGKLMFVDGKKVYWSRMK